jgi:2-keto-4-pentenoate hydratase/2-oxohepta-3-ene-1,7-dioic acid hydratase in catechol pathway
MAFWLRFEHAGLTGFGILEGQNIIVHAGDMFGAPLAKGETLSLTEINLLTPCVPRNFFALWNNYHAAATKAGNAIPPEPLYLLKGANSHLAHAQAIRTPSHYDGKVVYEGELGIVIGKTARNVSVAEAARYIFGYTCVNDVTALELITRDASFAQWVRAKSFDTFGVFGPVIATDLDPATLTVRTLLNGRERQNYPCNDMIFSPAAIVSQISRELTLMPGDVIACGTSLGAGVLKPGSEVEVVIDGIGSLRNPFQPESVTT